MALREDSGSPRSAGDRPDAGVVAAQPAAVHAGELGREGGAVGLFCGVGVPACWRTGRGWNCRCWGGWSSTMTRFTFKIDWPGQTRATRPVGASRRRRGLTTRLQPSFKRRCGTGRRRRRDGAGTSCGFVVHWLTQFGYRTDAWRTWLVVEHGTAAVREGLRGADPEGDGREGEGAARRDV